MYAIFAFFIIAAYMLGSVPFGLIIAKAHGKNLRKIGSGNIGATNLSRALGRKWAYFCFSLDMLKGLVPVLTVAKFISFPPNVTELFLVLSVSIAAVLGHIFPVYVKFKGGKGVATSFGVAVGLWPYFTICAGIAVVIWSVTVLISRYISLGSIIAALTFPVTLILAIILNPGWHFSNLWPLLIAAVAIPVIVTLCHRQNIKRLVAGTESQVLKRSGKKQ